MTNLILEDGTQQRQHRKRLWDLLNETSGTLRIASAYVTDREFVKAAIDRKTLLMISITPMDIASGATSIETLYWMLRIGVECRVLPERPRLHAKVYIFGDSRAVVTSANLTRNALDSNLEAGAELKGPDVLDLNQWYDRLWGLSSPLTEEYLSELKDKAATLRLEYKRLEKLAKTQISSPVHAGSVNSLIDSLEQLLDEAQRFFVCNTFRRHGEKTPTGGYVVEQAMYNRNFAAAWEDFDYPGHMEQVESGDAILMFAKGVGIIGIGVARSGCELLSRQDPNRILPSVNEKDIEWRVPVDWLVWEDEAGAYPYKSPNMTFWNVTNEGYEELRKGIRAHFLGGA